MRSAAEMAGNMDIVREIGATATFRKTHLEFNEVSRSDGATFSNGQSHDVDNYGTGFLRIASVYDAGWTRRLYYQYVSNPNGSWPAWTNTGIQIEQDSRPGVRGGRIYYTTPGRAVVYRDFNGTSIGSANTLFTDSAGTKAHMIAPVSDTGFYIYWQSTGEKPRGFIRYYDTSGLDIEWPGVAYNQGVMPFFDAVRVGSRDYIFFTEADNRRAMMMTRYNNVWSDPVPVIPLDLEDEYSSFQLGGVNLINGKIFVSGRLKRNYGSPMQVYLYGVDHLSMGRDFVIAVEDTQAKAVTIYGESRSILMPAGKVLTHGGEVWYIGLGLFDKAEGTLITGYDNPNLFYETSDIIQVSFSQESNTVSRMTMALKSDITSPIVAAGNELTLQLSYGGASAVIGKYEIVGVSAKDEPAGKRFDIVAESMAMNRVNRWKADASYDYWSQTKVGVLGQDVLDLSKLVRASGKWGSGSSMRLISINEDSYLYSVEKPCRNAFVAVDFIKSGGLEKWVVGPVVNYYKETRKEAAIRLNKPEDEITDSDYGHNGIVAAHTHDIGNGNAGVVLYLVRSNVWTALASAPYAQVPSSVGLSFQDGYIRVLVWGEDETWDQLISHRFTSTADDPWVRGEMVGRAGVFAKRISASATSYPIQSTSSVIPLSSISGFPYSAWVRIDNEEIFYAGRGGTTAVDNLSYNPGQTVVGNTSTGSGVQTRQIGHTTGVAKRQSFTLNSDLLVRAVRLNIFKQGNPTVRVEVGIYRDDGTAWGTRIGGGTYSSNEFNGWTTLMLSSPADCRSGQKYYLTVSTEGLLTSDTDFYHLQTGNGNPYANGELETFNGSVWSTYAQDPDMLFELYGTGELDSNKVCVTGLPEPPYQTAYNDMALYVKSGQGTGNVFKVIGYQGIGANIGILTLDQNVSYVIGEDSKFILLPTLKVAQRGANATTATSHGQSVCHLIPESDDILDPDPSIILTGFRYASSEQDMRLEDMIGEIANKAGVDYTVDREFQGIVNFNSGSLDVETGREYEVDRRNCIVRITPNSWSGEFGVMARRFGPDGMAVTITNTHVSYYTYHDGTFNLIERYPIGFLPAGTATFSVFDRYLSVWVEGRHIYTFCSMANLKYGTTYVIGRGQISLNVDWSQLDQRVDNYILDMGRSGLQLINDLVRERRVFFQDDQFGRLRAFRNRVRIPEAYEYAVVNSTINSTIGLVSRTRIIGGEIVELHDEELLRTHGNVFALGNSERLESELDIYEEILRGYRDVRGYRTRYSFSGAFDPRVEANDVLPLALPDGEVDVIVDSMSVSLSRTRESAVLDMTVEAHNEA